MGEATGIANLNPYIVPENFAGTTWHLLWNSLVQQTPTGAIAPDLARSWAVSDGGKTLTFHLNPAAKFSNGAPVTAADAAFSINYGLKPTTNWNFNFLSDVKSVKASGPTTLVMMLDRPNSDIPVYLTYAMIIDPANVKQISTHPIGSGPYVVSSYTPNDSLVLKANPSYWGPTKPHFQTIELVQTSDTTAAVTDLESGALDGEFKIPPTSAKALTGNPKLHIINPLHPVHFAVFEYDVRAAPFNDPRVREALSYATDRKTMVDTAYAGQGLAATGDVPLPPGTAGVTLPGKPYPWDFDISKAKALFAAAGIKSLTLWNTNSVAEFATMGQILQQDLAKAGVTLKIENSPNANSWYERFGPPPTKKWGGFFVPGLYIAHNDAGAILSQFIPHLCNCDYSNPKFTNEVAAGLEASDPATAQQHFTAAVNQWVKDLPLDVVAWEGCQMAMSTDIKGAFVQGDCFARLDQAVRTDAG